MWWRGETECVEIRTSWTSSCVRDKMFYLTLYSTWAIIVPCVEFMISVLVKCWSREKVLELNQSQDYWRIIHCVRDYSSTSWYLTLHQAKCLQINTTAGLWCWLNDWNISALNIRIVTLLCLDWKLSLFLMNAALTTTSNAIIRISEYDSTALYDSQQGNIQLILPPTLCVCKSMFSIFNSSQGFIVWFRGIDAVPGERC